MEGWEHHLGDSQRYERVIPCTTRRILRSFPNIRRAGIRLVGTVCIEEAQQDYCESEIEILGSHP